MCPRQRPTIATETSVEESDTRRKNEAARIEGAGETTARITARVVASVDEAIIAVSSRRPSFREEKVMGKLEFTTWIGRVIALQDILGL